MNAVHLNIKPYKCDACDSSFVTKGNLKSHANAVHLNLKHECEKCNKAFSQKSKLNWHVKNKHGEN